MILELLVGNFPAWLKTDTQDGEKQINIKSKLHLENWKSQLPICKFVSYVKKKYPTFVKKAKGGLYSFSLSYWAQSNKPTHRVSKFSRAVSVFYFLFTL